MADALKLKNRKSYQEMIFDDKPFVNFTSEEGAIRIIGILVEKKETATITRWSA
jgi:hypothetical protein